MISLNHLKESTHSEVDAWLAKGNEIKQLEPSYFNPYHYKDASGEDIELVAVQELKAKIEEYGINKVAKKLGIGRTGAQRILRQPTIKKSTYDKYMRVMK